MFKVFLVLFHRSLGSDEPNKVGATCALNHGREHSLMRPALGGQRWVDRPLLEQVRARQIESRDFDAAVSQAPNRGDLIDRFARRRLKQTLPARDVLRKVTAIAAPEE